MEDFAELCRLYQEQRVRNRNYALRAAEFVRQFAAELGRQIGAPKSFKLPPDGTEIPYIRPLKFDQENDRFDALGGFGDCLPWNDGEGRWHAGVGIHLEPSGPRSFPKTEFTIQLRFRLQDEDCELQIASYKARETFRIKDNDASSWKPAIEHTAGVLVRGLKLEPWEPYQEKQRIGFAWTDKEG
jgi:hypothetical protein